MPEIPQPAAGDNPISDSRSLDASGAQADIAAGTEETAGRVTKVVDDDDDVAGYGENGHCL